jgi:hypothetical protein
MELELKNLAQSQINTRPPYIKFRITQVKIDWFHIQPVIIIADISDLIEFSVMLNITNAENVITDVNKVSKTNTIVTITYYPKLNEYPHFE